MYKGSPDNRNYSKLIRISAIIIMVMVWILIDKGNIYGQDAAEITSIAKSDESRSIQSPSLREGDGRDDLKIESDEGTHFTVKPNPVVQDLVFDFEFTIKTGIPYEVIDPLGRLAAEGTFDPGIATQTISFADLQDGMYLVRLDMGDRLEVRRIIKK